MYLFSNARIVGLVFRVIIFPLYFCLFFKGVAAHELGHGTVFKTKSLNKIFLLIYSLLSWHNHHEYNISHTYHHRYTLHPEGDREVVLPLEVLIGNPIYLLQIFTFNFTGGPVTSGLVPIVKGTIQTAFGGNGASIISEEWSKAIYTAHNEERRKAVIWARIIPNFSHFFNNSFNMHRFLGINISFFYSTIYSELAESILLDCQCTVVCEVTLQILGNVLDL